MHKSRISSRGLEPSAKWLAAPVSAEKVMMNTLCHGGFELIPQHRGQHSSFIMPPPAPKNPQISPITVPPATP